MTSWQMMAWQQYAPPGPEPAETALWTSFFAGVTVEIKDLCLVQYWGSWWVEAVVPVKAIGLEGAQSYFPKKRV